LVLLAHRPFQLPWAWLQIAIKPQCRAAFRGSTVDSSVLPMDGQAGKAFENGSGCEYVRSWGLRVWVRRPDSAAAGGMAPSIAWNVELAVSLALPFHPHYELSWESMATGEAEWLAAGRFRESWPVHDPCPLTAWPSGSHQRITTGR